jgi:CRISPR-associated protein Cas5d
MSGQLVTVRVWGDFACFTRPEMKVERVSYPVMTPSAARGVLEAIFWEPEMYYLIDSISVVQRGRWLSFRRNEVISVISLDSAKTWMKAPEKFTPIQAGGGAPDGTQRNMLGLKTVEYLISAEVHLTELGRKSDQKLQKYTAEIKRRARTGKCYHRPYLGVREFAADFSGEDDAAATLERRAGELGSGANWPEEDLGLMLYDVFDRDARARGFRWLAGARAEAAAKASKPRWEGSLVKPEAAFFHARIDNAKLDCHPQRVRLLRNRMREE